MLTNLWVDSKRMMSNINSQKGLVMAEKVMIELVDGGIPRDEAHEILRSASMTCISEGKHLKEICENISSITDRFSAEQIEHMFDPASHVGVSGELVDDAVDLARKQIA